MSGNHRLRLFLGMTTSTTDKGQQHPAFLQRNINRCPDQNIIHVLPNICEIHRGIYVDGIESVHREEHQICGEYAVTSCLLHEEQLPSMQQCDLKWVCLVSRWAEAKLVMLYHIANNLLVVTSSLTIAPTCTRANTQRDLESSTRLKAYKHSFFPSTIKSWNKCIQHLVSKQ